MIGDGVAPQSSYSIDDGTSVSFIGTQQSLTQYKQLFFQSDILPLNNHTLRIETLASGGNYYLDFLSVLAQNSTGSSVPAASPSPTAVQTMAHSPSKNVPIGAIVGGVLGGIGVIVLTIIVVFLLKRKEGRESHRIDHFVVTRKFPVVTLLSDSLQHRPAASTSPETRTEYLYTATRSDITDSHDATASNSYISHRHPSVPPPRYEKS